MNNEYDKLKKWIETINENTGFLTLLLTVVASLSVFIFNLSQLRYEIGYNSFFGLKKVIRVDFNFIGIFFIFIAVLLFYISSWLSIPTQYHNNKEEKFEPKGSKLAIQIMLITLAFIVLYLYILIESSFMNVDVLQYIFVPLIPLLIMIFTITMYSISRNYCTLILTIFLCFITMLSIGWALFNDFIFFGSIMVTVAILMISSCFSFTGWIGNKLWGKKLNGKIESEKNEKNIKLTFLHVVVMTVLLVIIIACTLISISSTGWNDAKRTSEIYMTTYNDKDYVLFDQSNHYFALPIEVLNEVGNEDSNAHQISIKISGKKYINLSKENIFVELVKVDKITREDSDDSIIIEYSKIVL